VDHRETGEREPRVGASGLGWVALCIVGSGVFTYVYLALVARSVPVEDYGWFGSYWSLALVIGFGAFQPIELELARLVHLRPPGAPLPRGATACLATLTAASTAAVLLSAVTLVRRSAARSASWPPWSPCAWSPPDSSCSGGCCSAAGGSGCTVRSCWSTPVCGSSLAVGVSVLVPTAGGATYAWTLVVAMAVAHLPLLAWISFRRRVAVRPRPAGEPSARVFAGAVGHLLTGSLAAQVLLNAAPVLVTVLAAPGEEALAARFVASYTLVRERHC
jgi:hypothetical protein